MLLYIPDLNGSGGGFRGAVVGNVAGVGVRVLRVSVRQVGLKKNYRTV